MRLCVDRQAGGGERLERLVHPLAILARQQQLADARQLGGDIGGVERPAPGQHQPLVTELELFGVGRARELQIYRAVTREQRVAERLPGRRAAYAAARRSEEHTSELQSLMRISYAV